MRHTIEITRLELKEIIGTHIAKSFSSNVHEVVEEMEWVQKSPIVFGGLDDFFVLTLTADIARCQK
jgi:hypothetical protein